MPSCSFKCSPELRQFSTPVRTHGELASRLLPSIRAMLAVRSHPVRLVRTAQLLRQRLVPSTSIPQLVQFRERRPASKRQRLTLSEPKTHQDIQMLRSPSASALKFEFRKITPRSFEAWDQDSGRSMLSFLKASRMFVFG
jgi:hypothetical protein